MILHDADCWIYQLSAKGCWTVLWTAWNNACWLLLRGEPVIADCGQWENDSTSTLTIIVFDKCCRESLILFVDQCLSGLLNWMSGFAWVVDMDGQCLMLMIVAIYGSMEGGSQQAVSGWQLLLVAASEMWFGLQAFLDYCHQWQMFRGELSCWLILDDLSCLKCMHDSICCISCVALMSACEHSDGTQWHWEHVWRIAVIVYTLSALI
jgi:hypothetical protein